MVSSLIFKMGWSRFVFGLGTWDHPCSGFGSGTSKGGTMHLTCEVHMSASPFLLLPCTKSSFKPHAASSHPPELALGPLLTHTLLSLPTHRRTPSSCFLLTGAPCPSLEPLPHPHSSSARAHPHTRGSSGWSSPACGSACTSFPWHWASSCFLLTGAPH
jgi:hypothetical protein